MRWASAIITVPERRETLLPRTLESLNRAGFGPEVMEPPSPCNAPGVVNTFPILFVDGTESAEPWKCFGMPVVTRYPKVRAFGNWILALWEIWIREPEADRYAMFQDDFVTYKNLRYHLERCQYPNSGYWNLYNFPINEQTAEKDKVTGWYPTVPQRGLGAVALIFDRQAVEFLLADMEHIIKRPRNTERGYCGIDGGVVDALKKVGYKEFVHYPSLVQHTGKKSALDDLHDNQFQSTSFRGEEFDALGLLDTKEKGAVVNGLAGAEAYYAFPEADRPKLVDDWKSERVSLVEAMNADKERLKVERSRERRKRYSLAIREYEFRLAKHDRNNPPYVRP